jgi:hypothetical protein
MPQQASVAKPSNLSKRDAFVAAIRKNRKLSISYAGFLLIYALFALIPRPSQQTLIQYHLSPFGVWLIYLTIIILLAAIWGAGFYGYVKLRAYVKLVHDGTDGKNVKVINRGIFLLVMWLPVSEDISTVLNYFAIRHQHMVPVVTIIDNYINLALPLAAFIFIGMGARGLSVLVERKYTYYISSLLMLAVAYVGIIYAHLVAATSNRTLVYHMSLWLILLTIVAPYVYMWFTGAMAAYEVHSYQRKVGGLLYRRSWNLLAFGCGWLIVTSIIFQFLTTLSARLGQLSIYWILAIIYSLLAVLSVGYVLIALGAARLQKIEEV